MNCDRIPIRNAQPLEHHSPSLFHPLPFISLFSILLQPIFPSFDKISTKQQQIKFRRMIHEPKET